MDTCMCTIDGVCQWCGDKVDTFDSMEILRKRISELEAERDKAVEENKALREAHTRNLKERCCFDDRGHRCGWRVIAEGMQQRSKQALQEGE